jgi:plastocyanin
MGGIGSRIALGLAAAVAVFGVMAGSANAAATIQSDPTAYKFLPGPYVQGLGEEAIFDNSASTSYHDIRANQLGPDGNPLFYADAAPGGTVKVVKGTEYLKAGTYPFYCVLHGTSMSGELTIDSTGTIVSRPTVKVSFVKQKLKQVRKSGIRIKVKAVTAAKNVILNAYKGKAGLGMKQHLNFKAGQTKTVTIPLSKAGRKAIKKGKSVKIKVKSSVLFGKPSIVTRKVK